MKILIVPDKFKSSLTAHQAAGAIAEGIRQVIPLADIDLCPIADGGEGTVTALVTATGGRFITRRVTGPLPEMKVDATFGILGDNKTAVIEMAAASGLALLKPEDRDPLNTTTFGVGELIAAAIHEGARKIILGIGGSATTDAGIGCAQACGFTILLHDGEPTSPTEPLCGRDLPNILMIKHGRGEITNGIEIIAAYDVTNPLFGPNGAARVYGPQKGASPDVAEQLDRELQSLAQRTGKIAEANTPGAGSGGGMGFGLLAFFGATLRNGFELIADTLHLPERITTAALCFTAEGCFDASSAAGKATVGVARLCKQAAVPCIVLAGSIGHGAEQTLPLGVTAYFSIANGPMTLEESQRRTGELLSQTAANCMRLFHVHSDNSEHRRQGPCPAALDTGETRVLR